MFSIFISCNNNEVSFKSLIENKNLIKLSINSISKNPAIEVDSLIDSVSQLILIAIHMGVVI